MFSAKIYNSSIIWTIFFSFSSLLLLIWYFIKRQSYWKDIGVPYVKSYPVFGWMLDFFIGKPLHEMLIKRYFSMPLVFGYYEGNRPLLHVGDPHLLKDILIKDFNVFPYRRSQATNANDNIVDNMLSSLEGEDWKRVRSIITPTFSTLKLKRLMSIFKDCSKTLIQNFNAYAVKKQPINMKKIYNAFITDVIASSAFSTKLDSHNDPDNQFAKRASTAFTGITWRYFLLAYCPSLMKIFKICLYSPTTTNFFRNLVCQIVETRKITKQTRNDFLQLLIDTTEEIKEIEDNEKFNENDDFAKYFEQKITIQNRNLKKNLSINEMVSQCVSFFLAGSDTIGITLSLATYFLAVNKNVQNKAREEIVKCLKETQGQLTYEALQSMKYLDCVIFETLRMYPPAFRTERRAAFDYKLGDTGITIKKGIHVNIPIYCLQHDPKYYPDPEKFDPNRFTEQERVKRSSCVYLPFGAGPRNCIGMRFALMEIKICLVYVLSCFKINICSQTQVPVQFHKGYRTLAPKDIFLMMEPTQECELEI